MSDSPVIDTDVESLDALPSQVGTCPAQRTVRATGALLLAIAMLAGCSTDTADDDSATASSSPSQTTDDVCADVDAATSSLEDLLGTKILQEGTDVLDQRFATFETDVRTLLASAQSEFAPETATVTASVAALKDALAGLKQEPTASDAALITASLQAVKASTEKLISAVGSTC